jgi:hypothetical protein
MPTFRGTLRGGKKKAKFLRLLDMWVQTHHLSFYFFSNYKEIEIDIHAFFFINNLHKFLLVNKQWNNSPLLCIFFYF